MFLSRLVMAVVLRIGVVMGVTIERLLGAAVVVEGEVAELKTSATRDVTGHTRPN